MKKVCRTCEHYLEHGNYRVCKRISDVGTNDVYISGACCNEVELTVVPDFGCTLWEPKVKVKEEPHPMLCFQHGGSSACEDSNEKYGFDCPKCVAFLNKVALES